MVENDAASINYKGTIMVCDDNDKFCVITYLCMEFHCNSVRDVPCFPIKSSLINFVKFRFV